MRTVLLEINETIYTQVFNFLRLLPESQCHIVETTQLSKINYKSLNITSAFGLVKTPFTATLAEIEQGIVEGSVDDTNLRVG